MRKTAIFTIILFFCILDHGICQDQMVTNLLKAPTSPVAQLLNFSPSIIEKPTDLSALWLSIKNSTNDFSKLPNSYAVDLSPAEIFKSQYQTLQSLSDSVHTRRIMGETFVLSIGFQQFTDSTTKLTYPKTGIGLKTSFFRPAWDSTTMSKYDALTGMQDSLADLAGTAQQRMLNDPTVKKLLAQRDSLVNAHQMNTLAYKNLETLIQTTEGDKLTLYLSQTASDLEGRIKTAATSFTITRRGFSLDLAGGFTAAFPTNQIEYSLADKAGLWLTGGYVKRIVSILGIVRYLYQPDSIFADSTGKLPTSKVSTLDGGLSLNITSTNTKFNLALEAVYRSVLNRHSPITPSWHVVLNASYSLGDNKLISLNFGRDFDGVLASGGNLIAGLNLVLGFGGAKTIPNSKSNK
jgi:hypothetical protein